MAESEKVLRGIWTGFIRMRLYYPWWKTGMSYYLSRQYEISEIRFHYWIEGIKLYLEHAFAGLKQVARLTGADFTLIGW